MREKELRLGADEINLLMDCAHAVNMAVGNKDGLERIAALLDTAEDYEILHPLAKGGHSEVFVVRAIKTGQIYAMKKIHKTDILNDPLVNPVMRERASMISGRNSTWLLGLHKAFQDRNALYFLTDFISGGDLGSLCCRDGEFSEQSIRFYAGEILQGLKELHSLGLIHRDIKPENVLIDSEGHIRIADFGSATTVDGTDHEVVVGTPDYVAPELLCMSGKTITAKVDLWSLGVVMYELKFGTKPFYEDTVRETYKRIMKIAYEVGECSKDLEDIIRKLLAPEESRIGVEEAMQHSFFSQFDFSSKHANTPERTFYPSMEGAIDNFETDEFIPATVAMPSVLEGMRSFVGFGYDPEIVFTLPETESSKGETKSSKGHSTSLHSSDDSNDQEMGEKETKEKEDEIKHIQAKRSSTNAETSAPALASSLSVCKEETVYIQAEKKLEDTSISSIIEEFEQVSTTESASTDISMGMGMSMGMSMGISIGIDADSAGAGAGIEEKEDGEDGSKRTVVSEHTLQKKEDVEKKEKEKEKKEKKSSSTPGLYDDTSSTEEDIRSCALSDSSMSLDQPQEIEIHESGYTSSSAEIALCKMQPCLDALEETLVHSIQAMSGVSVSGLQQGIESMNTAAWMHIQAAQEAKKKEEETMYQSRKHIRKLQTELRDLYTRVDREIEIRIKLSQQKEDLASDNKDLRDQLRRLKLGSCTKNFSVKLYKNKRWESTTLYLDENCIRIDDISLPLNKIYFQNLKKNEILRVNSKGEALSFKLLLPSEEDTYTEHTESSSEHQIKITPREEQEIKKELAKETAILEGIEKLLSVVTSEAGRAQAMRQKIGTEKKIQELSQTLVSGGAQGEQGIIKYNNHTFKSTTFNMTLQVWCHECNRPLYGLTKQGLLCKGCRLVCHKECHTLVGYSCELYLAMEKGTSIILMAKHMEDKERIKGIVHTGQG
ncbi:serine/threonine-protein kinase MRCK [Nematocida sp. AWRm77]|nr:serine/threonine-protein kinase MRCK [Nematocida sp. AWRm77]